MRVELKSAGIYTDLCEEGRRLYEAWQKALELHAASHVIYKAMQAYFVHRNGVNAKNYSKRDLIYCSKCSGWKVIKK